MPANKQMKPDVWDLERLFKGGVQWIVPVYQRPYVWKSKEDDQIPGMWDDWQAQTEKLLVYREASPHYFGAIIYLDRKKRLGDIDKMELVDGQQRLTTFQLALAALRDTGKVLKYKNTDDIESYILNKTDDEDEYKILPSRHDRDVFCKIVSPHEYRNYPAENELIKAYKYFCKSIKDFVDARKNEEEVEVLIDTLKEALLNYFQVVTIQLGEDDDPQQIFASLNGQAEPLSPFDLIRNDIFYRARGNDGEIPEEFENEWGYFYDPFWTKKVGQALQKKARVDHFIIDVVIAQVAKEVKKHRIAAAYKNYVTNPPLGSLKELGVLKKYGKAYYAFQNPKEDDAIFNIAKMLRQWNLSTMNPLVLWIDTRKSEQLSFDDKRKLFSMIESYIVRREICNLNTKHFNKTVPAILSDMHNNKDNIINVFKDFLEKGTVDSTRMPTDGDVKLACRQLPIYNNINSAKLVYILKNIEERLADSRFRENTDKKISIEHIMPQGWKEHWRLKNAMGHIKIPHEEGEGITLDNSTQELVDERENLIHTIGNLTLVTSKFNSNLSNKSWSEKRGAIRKESDLKLNINIAEFDEWNEEIIKERSSTLADDINEIWPSS